MTEEIFQLAKALGHGAPEGDASLRTLCAAAEQHLAGRLKRGVTVADCAPAFLVAAAWLALSYERAGAPVEMGFTAGDLTLRPGDGAACSAALRAQAEQVLAPYLGPGCFSFLGVGG